MIHRHDIKSKYWICVYWWLRIWKVCLTCTCMRIEVATEEVLNNSICTSCIPFLVVNSFPLWGLKRFINA
ncbi:hypothetical protein ES319_D01G241500v1 [Gossypium barbadense]|uniref:Uncharacterized protein n=1 Tax=Gossypium barbadense TaxID=3634 RepID=A0A5J5SSE9_GOSBA|nr:hypothetical protein ES319_D01G241500v1 [Gossypium barbadense]